MQKLVRNGVSIQSIINGVQNRSNSRDGEMSLKHRVGVGSHDTNHVTSFDSQIVQSAAKLANSSVHFTPCAHDSIIYISRLRGEECGSSLEGR